MSSTIVDQAIAELKSVFSESTRFLVGFSGGMDSTVLLAGLVRAFPSEQLHAVYIDHGLQDDSVKWAQLCAKICQQYAISFQAIGIQIESTARQGVEAVARQKRYQALCSVAGEQMVLLTAHHQRDQVETLLLNLARGSGITGLAAMPKLKVWRFSNDSQTLHYRPLLQVPYSELQAYAEKQQLSWVDDPSNFEKHFRRNFVRHEILPKFNQAWPFFEANAAQSALHLSEGLALLNELAEIDFQQCEHRFFAIKMPENLIQDYARVKNVLRFWVLQYNLKLKLNQSIIKWIESVFRNYNLGSQPQRCLSKGELRIYRTTLFYYTDFQTDYHMAPDQFSPEILQFWNADLMADYHILNQRFVGQTVRLRAMSTVDNSWISSPQKLKSWFKQHHVPSWDRQRWPVVEVNHVPVAVLGFHSLKTIDGKKLPKR